MESKSFLSGRALKQAGVPERAGPCTKRTGFPFQVKRLCCAEDKSSACVVYEDMSCGGPNRMCTPNEYQ